MQTTRLRILFQSSREQQRNDFEHCNAKAKLYSSAGNGYPAGRGIEDTEALSTQLPTYLLGHLFTTEEMRAIFSDQRRIQAMLDFESALARALGRVGVIPKAAAATIQSKMRRREDLFTGERRARTPLIRARCCSYAMLWT
jgi:hypothetical protein